jgi:hypothetical protein
MISAKFKKKNNLINSILVASSVFWSQGTMTRDGAYAGVNFVIRHMTGPFLVKKQPVSCETHKPH